MYCTLIYISTQLVIACNWQWMFQQFYKLGYGHAINGDISCPLISHIFRQMDEQIKANR